MTAASSALPTIESLLLHEPPLRLLDSLQAHGADWVHCRVTPREGQLFTREGGVSAGSANSVRTPK